MKAQRAFVADAAHELRTPLSALKLQMQLAERASGETERQAAFADLKRGLERAIHLVQQLLTLARQEPGVSERVRQPVDLVLLAHSVIADFALSADTRRIDLGIGSETPATVQGDADALRIMLNNLVDNALHYTPEGGRIDLAVEADADAFSIVVQDSGPGHCGSRTDAGVRPFLPGRRYAGEGQRARAGDRAANCGRAWCAGNAADTTTACAPACAFQGRGIPELMFEFFKHAPHQPRPLL